MDKWGTNNRVKQFIATWFLLIFLILSFGTTAFSYDSILAFGDSLSDNGWAADGTGTQYLYGYQNYTDGQVWVQYLANTTHLNLTLFDMAYVGATTGIDDPALAQTTMWGLQWQVGAFLTNYSNTISSNTLVTVWAGGNDFLWGRSSVAAASNIALALQNLSNAGFRNFLVPNLPDIGKTPSFKGGPNEAAATAWSIAFNGYLQQELNAFRAANPADHVYTFDAFSLLNTVAANPSAYSAYGINSINDVFWVDGFHPSTKTHLVLADTANETVVPIPAAFFLFGSGLIGLLAIRRRLS